jgi:putative ABC transport system substrate-binding protein
MANFATNTSQALLALFAVFVLAACGKAASDSVADGGIPKRRVVYFVATDYDRERGPSDFRRFVDAVRRTPGIDLAHVSLELVNVVGPGSEPAEKALESVSRHPPDIIVATSYFSLDAVLRTSMNVPILFMSHPNPVELGKVKSLAAPGVNRTGFTFFSPVTAKHLETLHDAFPSVRRVGAIVDDYLMNAKWFTDDLRLAEASLGIEIHMFRATNIAALRRFLSGADALRMDAWYVPISDITGDDYDDVIQTLRALRKPIVYSREDAVRKGGTLAYEARLQDPFGIWARQLRLILAGVPAGVIPIEQPQSFEIAVNLDGSEEYPALRPSKAILERATHIYGSAER